MDKPDQFFSEKFIVLELPDGQVLRAFMRPLKVKEIGLACRVAKLQEGEAKEVEYLPHIIKLVENSIDIDIDELPIEVLNNLVEVFIELNFGDAEEQQIKAQKAKKRDVIVASKLAIAFDFLIHQGHKFSDILEYTLPQVRLFQQTAVERLTGTKRVDPVKALVGAGVKLKS
ncbi:MAG: hypothetical protein SCALA701_25870 [Candidatus Scalindua sp.]|nr:hypothetical protein [Planctomycetota bacterium]RZV82921.1 MAG: hypothetical protein EX341_09015 [Candidatus Scalindua sp. SCAELEC01]GJQ59786.1 MAG: hypothetical protein SCALA701_25870 [Candidatus Scalindua sp.]